MIRVILFLALLAPLAHGVRQACAKSLASSEVEFAHLRSGWFERNFLEDVILQPTLLPRQFHGKAYPYSLPQCEDMSSFHAHVDDVMRAYSLGDGAHGRSAVAIVTICYGVNFCNIFSANHRAYAAKHGYDYLSYERPFDGGENPKMDKFVALDYALRRQGKTMVAWIDADIIITRMETPLEELFREYTRAGTSPQLLIAKSLVRHSLWCCALACWHDFSEWNLAPYLCSCWQMSFLSFKRHSL